MELGISTYMVIDGEKIAEDIIAGLKRQPVPGKFLAAIVVGDDPASVSFMRQKEKVARELGVDFQIYRRPTSIDSGELGAEIEELAGEESCGGIILQLPLPSRLDRARIIAMIPEEKDVDALRGGSAVPPPAVGVVHEIIENCELKIENLTVAVVGMGFLVGQPVAKWFRGRAKELLTLDVGDDLARLKNADVVILGVGKAGLVKPEMLKENALVIDFGYSRGTDGTLYGDFDSSQIENWKLKIGNLRYTPVPHGTGPILVAKLFENFYLLNAD